MKRQHYVVAVLCMLMVSVSVLAQKNNKITLKLNLEKGQVYNQKFITKQKIKQVIFGQNNEMEQEIGMTYLIEVLDKDKQSNMLWKVTYKTVKWTQESAMAGKMEYDSEKNQESTNPYAAGFKALVGQSFQARLTPEGKVLEVKGAEEMMNSIIEKSDIKGEQQKKAMRETLSGQYGEEGLKSMLETSFAVYPNKPVAIGDTWTGGFAQKGMQSMNVANTFKLVGIKDGIAQVEVNSVITPNENDTTPNKSTFSGKQNGTSQIDIKTGWVNQSTVKQDLKGKVSVQGMEIEMDILGDILLEKAK